MNPLDKLAELFAEIEKEALNSTAMQLLQQKKKEFAAFIKSKEDELTFDWKKIEKDFNQDIDIWIGEVCDISEECRNDIAGGNEGDSTPILADALISIIGNIDMRFTIAVEILKGAAKAMKSESCNNLSSFNNKWKANLRRQTIDFHEFKLYLYSKYKLMHPSSKLKDMNDGDIIEEMDLYIKERLIESKKMSKLYTDAWLASTKDKDTGYWAEKDKDAGYFVIKMTYVCPTVSIFNMEILATNGSWKDYKAYIDDIEKPDGTKQRLANEFGGGTRLVDLPYKVVVIIEVQPERSGKYLLPMENRLHKTPEGNWNRDYGHVGLINTWFQKMQNQLTINDLIAEK